MTDAGKTAKPICMLPDILKIGTRGSPLAMVQTKTVEALLRAAFPALEIGIVPIRTSGDWKPEDGEKRLSESEGGKGLFAREIEKALLEGHIDCAVHSLKDMASFLPGGLVIDHVIKREDPRDAFVSFKYDSVDALPEGAVVGTSSLRRQALLLARRPDLQVVPLRGNVQTRLDKLKDGMADATFLAMAGLNRLNISGNFVHAIPTEIMLPACAQGIVGIERRMEDERVKNLLDAIHHYETGLCAKAERAALQVLDGSCHTPIGAYARLSGDEMQFDLVVASGGGRQVFRHSAVSDIAGDEQAAAFGADIAAVLKKDVPADIFA